MKLQIRISIYFNQISFVSLICQKGRIERGRISFGQSNYGYRYSLNISSPSKFLNSFSGLPQIGSFLTAIPEGYNVPYKGMLILTEKQDGLYAIVFLSPKENFDSVLNEIKPTL